MSIKIWRLRKSYHEKEFLLIFCDMYIMLALSVKKSFYKNKYDFTVSKNEDEEKPTLVQQNVLAWLVFSMFFIPISNTYMITNYRLYEGA